MLNTAASSGELSHLSSNYTISCVASLTFQFVGETFDVPFLTDLVEEWHEKERGSFPTPIECLIIIWIFSIMWKEVKEVYEVGLREYISDMWNLADIFTNFCFIGWIVLRITAWIIVKREEAVGINPYYPREEWHAYDPFLISEGLFGAGMISCFLKLIHIFSINPHLGPLQVCPFFAHLTRIVATFLHTCRFPLVGWQWTSSSFWYSIYSCFLPLAAE